MSKKEDTAAMEQQESVCDNVRVTERTGKYIKFIDEVDNLWNRIYDQIEEDYGSSSVDERFDKDFYPHLCGVKDSLFDALTDTIRSTMKAEGGKIFI